MTKKITKEMMQKATDAIYSMGGTSITKQNYLVELAVVAALSPLVYRAHPDTRVRDRRARQEPARENKYYRFHDDRLHSDDRGTGKDRRKTKRGKK